MMSVHWAKADEVDGSRSRHRDVNAEQAQARERGGHGLRSFRLNGVEQDLEVIDGRLVDFRRRALQQLSHQLLGGFEVSAQELALRAFEPYTERQLVMAAP